MQKIWVGAKDNKILHATSEQALSDYGVSNAQSFTVDGQVTGLSFIDGPTGQQNAQGNNNQTA